MDPTFKEYLEQARKDFAQVAAKYSVEEHLELRTAIDSLLIAYDQATDKALSITNVVVQIEQSKAEVFKLANKLAISGEDDWQTEIESKGATVVQIDEAQIVKSNSF